MKVAICIPTLDMCPIDFALSLASMLTTRAYDKKFQRDVDLALLHQTGSIIMDARNNLVKRAQEINATHVLFLDSDMAFPPDTLRRLIDHHVPIVCGSYVKRVPPHQVLGEPDRAAPRHPSGLIPMQTIPLGCALISLKVFDAMEEPYFRYLTTSTGTISEDTFWSVRAREKGFTIYMDPKLTAELGHVGVKAFRAP